MGLGMLPVCAIAHVEPHAWRRALAPMAVPQWAGSSAIKGWVPEDSGHTHSPT
jgi:hypothetical protein